MKKLGIDIGSLYLGSVLLEDEQIVARQYGAHQGNIERAIGDLLQQPQYRTFDTIGLTGSLASRWRGAVDTTLAMIEGSTVLLPHCRQVFVIGGETFSLLIFDETGHYREHAINPPCAAGTGSFIEQQAQRLNISVAELAHRACGHAGKTPTIATRCAVFAKTDIIHAMQEGYALDAICAGLCEGIARNIGDVLVKGRNIKPPVGVIGGVSRNAKIMRTMQEILGGEIVVPPNAEVAGAIGAARLSTATSFDVAALLQQESHQRQIRSPLRLELSHYPDLQSFGIHSDGNVEIIAPHPPVALAGDVFIGFDIGSTSTKAIVITPTQEIVAGFYTATCGEPIAAVKRLITTINTTLGGKKIRLHGVGTTGSGRKMIKELFHADLEADEITAHAKAAVHLYPEVDTIIEIGGQDAKFTRIRGGEVYYSTMNYVCAAGTGSFIEEQARRLGVTLGDFSAMALGAQAPYTSDRCTVYMERDLGVLLGEGWSKEALAAAVLNSVRDNYLAKVVNRSPIGDFIVFQGATARNVALVAAFENFLHKPIHVSPYSHLTGALGMALLCKAAGLAASSFHWAIQNIHVEGEVCQRCVNKCSLTVVSSQENKTGWGMKCGREYAGLKMKKTVDSAPQRRFAEAMAPLFVTPAQTTARTGITIGLPNTLYQMEYLPLWHNFLSRLGFTVQVTAPLRQALAKGKAIVNADFCAPMILAHGYLNEALAQGADYLFYPALVNAKDPDGPGELSFTKKTTDTYFCYYSQYLPTLWERATALPASPHNHQLISPLVYFRHKSIEQIAGDIYTAMHAVFPYLGQEEVTHALVSAYAQFTQATSQWAQTYGRVVGAEGNGDKPRIVLLGRPYVVFDPVINLNIPQKLEEMGADIFWQDELELDHYEPAYANQFYTRMHWQYGRKIVKLAEYCARADNLFAIYLTCFRCSPDAFLISYVKDIMNHYDKPFLILQLDEHSSDVGYTTRMEAGLRSFRNYLAKHKIVQQEPVVTHARDDALQEGDTVLVAYLDSLISQFWADAFTRVGHRAILLDADAKSLSTGYKYASGGECMPLVSIVGSVVEKVKSERLDPGKTFFYMPTVCMACNFPQFPIFADLAFRAAGIVGLKIGLINSVAPGLPMTLSRKLLESNMIGSVLYKLYHRIKPYETEKGCTDRVLLQAKQTISQAILQGKSLQDALSEAIAVFKTIHRDESKGRKPRIGLLGDFYVKYNEVVNQKIQSLVDELGGELLIPSITEYATHFFEADMRLHGGDPRSYELLRKLERRYEKLAEEIIGDSLEPDPAECTELMSKYGIQHYIAGETAINVGKALYYIENKRVEAILHINPMFCCPGVVTASIFRKIQEDFHIPIIDIFYDGTGNPNGVLIPYLHYLRR